MWAQKEYIYGLLKSPMVLRSSYSVIQHEAILKMGKIFSYPYYMEFKCAHLLHVSNLWDEALSTEIPRMTIKLISFFGRYDAYMKYYLYGKKVGVRRGIELGNRGEHWIRLSYAAVP
jgi:hypothetical protein